MSYIGTAALQTRLREVLEDGYGSLRTITADTYGGNLPEDFTGQGDSVRSLGQPQVECLITKGARSPSSPMTKSNVALYLVDVRVRVVRRLSADVQISETARDTIKAAAAADIDVIAQALGWPGNLTTTSAGAATGLVSGLLTHKESSTDVRSVVEDGASIVETLHLFTGTLQSAPAVS